MLVGQSTVRRSIREGLSRSRGARRLSGKRPAERKRARESVRGSRDVAGRSVLAHGWELQGRAHYDVSGSAAGLSLGTSTSVTIMAPTRQSGQSRSERPVSFS